MSTLILIIQVSGILLEPFFHLSFKRCFFFFYQGESHIKVSHYFQIVIKTFSVF